MGTTSGGADRCFGWEAQELRPSPAASDRLQGEIKGGGSNHCQSHLARDGRPSGQFILRHLQQLGRAAPGC